MNQEKVGKFISQCRKEKGLTQAQVAEVFGISNVAVSKWETGKSLPDASIMIDLCNLLGITVNELLNGDKINANEYKEKAEKQIIELQKSNLDFEKKQKVLKIINIAVILFALCVLVFGLRKVAFRPENEAVAALGNKYKKESVYVNNGFGDGTQLYKYAYSNVKIDLDGVLKNVSSDSKNTLLEYIDRFETWVKMDTDTERVSRYSFDRSIISNDDYVYIVDNLYGGFKYSNFDVYYFDTGTKILYYFHHDT